ncbi:hypothetical protein IQ03_03481 [Gemmobacter caeni]|uniref:Uncharacterized protein n=1 Tax=Gemmobacter caeni TaxID=589035 RepID=A0A2T6AT80_9RHOB|nr:hypothetical protein C8N34_11442 [Gemmobacter caeni]TWI96121.1 hypothetical protein IQ03_03481 [Gemmobacter caeni]
MTDDESLVDGFLRYGRLADGIRPMLDHIVELNDDLIHTRDPSCVLKTATRAREAIDAIITDAIRSQSDFRRGS